MENQYTIFEFYSALLTLHFSILIDSFRQETPLWFALHSGENLCMIKVFYSAFREFIPFAKSIVIMYLDFIYRDNL